MRSALAIAAALALCSTAAFAQSSPPGTGNMTPNGGGSSNSELTSATLQANPTNPTGTASTSGVMEGLGTTCKITPAYSGRIRFEISGDLLQNTSGDTTSFKVFFGTGTAPANAAAQPGGGTQVGNTHTFIAAATNQVVPATISGIVTGLTPGTAYWFDAGLSVNAGAGTNISNVSCQALEF